MKRGEKRGEGRGRGYRDGEDGGGKRISVTCLVDERVYDGRNKEPF